MKPSPELEKADSSGTHCRRKEAELNGSKMTKDKAIEALQHAAFDARDVGLNEEQIIEAVKAPTTEYQAELDACSGKSLDLGK
jgi:hypothetical protein